MIFQFPKLRINDTAWFLNEMEHLTFGTVKNITISINEEHVNVWYAMLEEDGEGLIINEKQILNKNLHIPSPKYMIGDDVNYDYQSEDRKTYNTNGTIDRIEIHIVENKPETCYIMDDDPDYWVLESDICGFSNHIIDMTKEKIVDEEHTVVLPVGADM